MKDEQIAFSGDDGWLVMDSTVVEEKVADSQQKFQRLD